METLATLAALALGYLLGSINVSVMVGAIYGKDVRNHGSKSAGLTNTLRVLGKSAAAFVLAGDILKAIVACLIGLLLGVQASSGGVTESITLLAAGAGVVAGHNWPVFFGFKGGKGALTAVTVLFMLDWRMGLICLGFFVAVVALSRYVSLGTIGASLLFAIVSFVPAFGHGPHFHVVTLFIALVVVARHTENIRRLLSGTESKLAL